MEPQDDIDAARTPSRVKFAGGLGILAGAIITLTGVQTLSGFRLKTLHLIVLAALILAGVALAFAGASLARARATGAILQLTLGILALVVSGAWLLLSLAGGLVSLFGLASPWLAGAALGMAIASLKSVDEVNAARRRLKEKGLDLGV